MKPFLANHLEKTSRTFALSIPLLSEPTRSEAAIAYLLFRVADTLEDSAWSPAARREALLEFAGVVDVERPDSSAFAANWSDRAERDDRTLLADLPRVLDHLGELDRSSRNAIRWQLGRTARGMAGYVSLCKQDGTIELRSIDELRHYCYVVAGIVGELLTSLFLARTSVSADIAQLLFVEAATFGEALQLVNVLKDEERDAREGRRFLPADVVRERIEGLASDGLVVAKRYTDRLRRVGIDDGIVNFLELTIGLADRSLDVLRRRGAGAKISRGDVAELLAQSSSRSLPVRVDPRAVRGGLPFALKGESR